MPISMYRLFFSRTSQKDYRWIYSSNCLSKNELEEIRSDYENLFYEYYKKDIEHLVIQRREKGFVIYRLVDTKTKDSWGTSICAITGLFIPYNKIIENSLSLIITECYFNLNYIYEISDKDKNIVYEDFISFENLHKIMKAKDESEEKKFRTFIDSYLLDINFEKEIKVIEKNLKYEIVAL